MLLVIAHMIERNIFSLVVLKLCLVAAVFAIVLTGYVTMGLTQILYIHVLVSILKNVFLYITFRSNPDI